MTFRYPLSILFLLCLFGFPNAPAQAQAGRCSTDPYGNYDLILEDEVTVEPQNVAGRRWPVGSMYGRWQPFAQAQTVTCANRTTLKLAVLDDRQLVSIGNNRYETGIAGTELTFGIGYRSTISMYAGDTMTVEANVVTRIPDHVLAMVVRTKSHVPRTGKSARIYYSVALMDGSQIVQKYIVNSSGINLINNIYLMSCAADQDVVQVPMGAVTLSSLRADASPIRSYDLNVTCEGGPTGKPPVKIYFVGETTPQGVLRLSRYPYTATGVGIAVSDTNGNPLPFTDQKKALEITHVGRINDIDRYHFQGRAQYVTIPEGQLGPGRADAAMTYVLDYN